MYLRQAILTFAISVLTGILKTGFSTMEACAVLCSTVSGVSREIHGIQLPAAIVLR
jgi:hypothetical protein